MGAFSVEMKLTLSLFSLALAIAGVAWPISQKTAKVEPVNFDKDVRPILSEHCFRCHGPDVEAAASGLRLDSFEGATKKAVVPGQPDHSLLIERVSAKDPDDRMPPSDSGVKPLTPAQIETLKTWISQGAKYEKHWSYVPPTMPTIPPVSDPKWVKNPVDRFVMAKLDAAGLKPEPEADRDTLALRAAQTLTGLPPDPALLEAFKKDKSPDAYERFVDKLLATPEYGEHQARYWLDAVRYGDTHGLQLDNERAVYPYRDWVIQAFNKDLPFDKFVRWQIAGDLLPNPTTEQLVATGYVRMNLTSNEGGAIPEEFLARNTFDRVDTTSTVMLGLTVGCAKCHDHKYDPIKQKDYYGLYAYFDSTQDEPLDGNISLPPPYVRASSPEQEAKIAAMGKDLADIRTKVDAAQAADWFDQHVEPIPATKDWMISPVYTAANFDEAFDKAFPGEPGQPAATWKPFAFELGKDFPGIIGKDNSSVYVKGTVTFPKAMTVTFNVASDDAIRMWLNGKLIHSHKIGRGLNQGVDVVRADFRAGDNELIAKVINGVSFDGLNIRFGKVKGDRSDMAVAAYRKTPTDPKAIDEMRDVFLTEGPESKLSQDYRKLQKDKKDFEDAIPMTLIAKEMAQPRPTFVLKRGEYNQKGDQVQRHIPAALGTLPVGQPNNRLGFANWLTDAQNPLVARVFANRIWQQHFGVGIVKTPEDFGSQGEWPVDQPLLDYLAVSFAKHGWSVKALNRLIVTSAAFRQSSKITKDKLAKDPENRLVSRGPRFRLDAEVIRDKALYAGGLLVEKIGGHGFKPYQPDGLWESSSDPASATHIYVRDHGTDIYRRSLYMFWKRTSPPPVMVTFDAPLRDSCIVRRSTTNTPLQALAMMNEPAFLEASRTLAARVLKAPGTDEDRLKKLYSLTLERQPKPAEVQLMTQSLARLRSIYKGDDVAAKKLLQVGDSPQSNIAPPTEQAVWMILCSGVMNTDEFLSQH
ncbi:MAG: DUF1553 domain-containing protein [Armatimonadetes bacterium]|nr:DUF1553 domain-containing protein [Armatimonadota bacterium]